MILLRTAGRIGRTSDFLYCLESLNRYALFAMFMVVALTQSDDWLNYGY